MKLTTKELRNFWRKVNKTNLRGCWIWLGAVRSDGYGVCRLRHKTISAHRLSFFLSGRKISRRKPCVLHKCDVKRCVNPDHLWSGTKSDNSCDMVSKGRHGRTKYPWLGWGERNGRAKLSELDVVNIRKRYARGGVSYSCLGREYDVPKGQIGRIVNRNAWVHVV